MINLPLLTLQASDVLCEFSRTDSFTGLGRSGLLYRKGLPFDRTLPLSAGWAHLGVARTMDVGRDLEGLMGGDNEQMRQAERILQDDTSLHCKLNGQ
jgi:hypothetical protein